MSGDATPLEGGVADRTAYACLLFAVNVGGRKVGSVALRGLAAEWGLADPATVANSGNLVVRPGTSGATDAAGIATLVHDAVIERFGVDAAVAVRTGPQLAAAIAANPFPDAAAHRPSRLQLLVGTRPVDPDGIAALATRHTGAERIAATDGNLYVDYPDGIAGTGLTTRVLTRAAGTPVTARNWNTVLALADLTTPRP